MSRYPTAADLPPELDGTRRLLARVPEDRLGPTAGEEAPGRPAPPCEAA